MLTRILFLLTLVLVGTVVLTGAWSGSFATVAQIADTRFTPRTVVLDTEIVGAGVTANDLLAKAMAKLDPDRTAWLKTKIRQTTTNGDTPFHAEGCLQRGPNHCVRLELATVRDGVRGQIIVVSDGELLVQVRRAGKARPTARLERLPELSDDAPAEDAKSREKLLAGIGCGGPLALLREFHERMKNATLQTGLLADQPVIRIRAEFDAVTPKIPARIGFAYLDAKTLWPRQIEWWSPDPSHARQPLAQIEFLEPEINQALSLDECTRIFSYQPSGDEKVTDK